VSTVTSLKEELSNTSEQLATVTQEKDGLVATVTSLKEELSNTSEQLATVTQ
jgi:predicted  nucleic acid-binding Zn-ribbon protein